MSSRERAVWALLSASFFLTGITVGIVVTSHEHHRHVEIIIR